MLKKNKVVYFSYLLVDYQHKGNANYVLWLIKSNNREQIGIHCF